MRQKLEAHIHDPNCAACHRKIDPFGLAFENFDAIGRWRTEDNGAKIDTASQLADGTAINGPAQLREAILRRPEMFAKNMAEQLMVYALGRRLEAEDMPTVRSIVRAAAKEDYRFSSIVLGIVRSPQFQQKARFSPSATQAVADTRAAADSAGVN